MAPLWIGLIIGDLLLGVVIQLQFMSNAFLLFLAQSGQEWNIAIPFLIVGLIFCFVMIRQELKRPPEQLPHNAEKNPPPDAECYLWRNGNQEGPFTPSQIRYMWNAGSITADTLYYYSQLSDWCPVKGFCQNSSWQGGGASDSELLKQVVAEQRKTSSQLWAIRLIMIAVFVIPFLIYQCSQLK